MREVWCMKSLTRRISWRRTETEKILSPCPTNLESKRKPHLHVYDALASSMTIVHYIRYYRGNARIMLSFHLQRPL